MRLTRRQLCGALASVWAGAPVAAQAQSSPGPAVGEVVPEIRAVDQNGRTRSFADLTGPNGLLLLFHRSADW